MRKKVATLDELKKVASTNVAMTVYRQLKKLSYCTSYSHNGRYYALNKVVKFDEQGLWSFQSIGFSKYGSLLNSLEQIVNESDRGFFANDLEKLFDVGVKESLLRLVQKGKLSREKVLRSYLYCAKNSTIRRRQIARRNVELSELGANIRFTAEEVSDEVKAAIILFTALLNEQQRRLFAASRRFSLERTLKSGLLTFLGFTLRLFPKERRSYFMGKSISSGFVRKAPGDRALKKKSRNPRRNPKADESRYRWGPHQRTKVDSKIHRKNCCSTSGIRNSGQQKYGWQTPQGH